MGTKRKKIGKNQRLRLKAKKRREAAAAADAAAKASAIKVFWPRDKNMTTSEEQSDASAYNSTRQSSQSRQYTSRQFVNDDQGRQLSIHMAKPRENKQPKYKVAQGYAEDHERRLKLIELYIESAADMFAKNRRGIDRASNDIQDLIDAFNGAVDEGQLIGQKTNFALVVLDHLAKLQTTANKDCTKQKEDLDKAREDIQQLFCSLTAISDASKASVESMKAMIDEKVGSLEAKMDTELQKIRGVCEERFTHLEQSITKTIGGKSASKGKKMEIQESQGSWRGRLRSRDQRPA